MITTTRRRVRYGTWATSAALAGSWLCAGAPTAAAAPAPEPVCVNDVCTLEITAAGIYEWTVPAGVSTLDATVVGAAGGPGGTNGRWSADRAEPGRGPAPPPSRSPRTRCSR
ncbi:hypothetical protein LQL77_29465 [Rhodococcus cerastii]|nr:hypothetical protein [Rhodococcus cerastii]